LIDENGNQVGVVATDEAKRMARERGYDLVEIAPNSRPPVCKILDYGKFLYEQKKKKRESEKKHHVQQVKAVRLRPKTGDHDLQTKVNKARSFLGKGDKVVFTVLFRGRENAHKDRGRDLLKRVIEELEDVAKVEGSVRAEGNRMHLTLLPKPAPKATTKKDKEKKKPEAETAPAPAEEAMPKEAVAAKGDQNAENEDSQSSEEKV
jgi:translation initiation factor IF-3